MWSKIEKEVWRVAVQLLGLLGVEEIRRLLTDMRHEQIPALGRNQDQPQGLFISKDNRDARCGHSRWGYRCEGLWARSGVVGDPYVFNPSSWETYISLELKAREFQNN